MVSFLFVNRISQRLDDFLQATKKVRNRAFTEAELTDPHEDEVGRLYSAFGEMSKQLNDAWEKMIAERKRSEELLLNIIPEEVSDEIKRG